MKIDTNVYGFVQNILKFHSIYRTNTSRTFGNHWSVLMLCERMYWVWWARKQWFHSIFIDTLFRHIQTWCNFFLFKFPYFRGFTLQLHRCSRDKWLLSNILGSFKSLEYVFFINAKEKFTYWFFFVSLFWFIFILYVSLNYVDFVVVVVVSELAKTSCTFQKWIILQISISVELRLLSESYGPIFHTIQI